MNLVSARVIFVRSRVSSFHLLFSGFEDQLYFMEPMHDVRARSEFCHEEFMNFKGIGSRHMNLMVTIER